MKICPTCGNVVAYNSYFGAYICPSCSWECAPEDNKRTNSYFVIRTSSGISSIASKAKALANANKQ